ncbi:MAG: hypothetical protein Q9207_008500 [Kuettlingeria erythrocarpa]
MDKPAAKDFRGYEKIKQSCALAHSQGYQYIWIDTCCIDKSSSAELSEAINSMYDWYRCSAICYVYLNDVPNDYITLEETLRQSRWFSRGWTLQELLAPYDLEFYNKRWRSIGDKIGLAIQISSAAQINPQYITDWGSVRRASVATRMSWASGRNTTRLEDVAYCLMGLFEVNMPLLYGEGRKAFLRLQHEIAKNSDDESLFAWYSVDSTKTESGIFADDPSCFESSQGIEPYHISGIDRVPNSITSRGLAMEAYYRTIGPHFVDPDCGHIDKQPQYALVPLHCANTQAAGQPFVIILKWLSRDICVRALPATPFDYRKYFLSGNPGYEYQKKVQHQMIYVREPPLKPAIQSNLGGTRIVPHSMNTDRYALKRWYLGRYSHVSIKASFFDWEINFNVPDGARDEMTAKTFAVLMFKRVGGPSTIVTLTLDGAAGTANDVALRRPLQSVRWTDLCEAADKVILPEFTGRWGKEYPREVNSCWQACGFSKDLGDDPSAHFQDGIYVSLGRSPSEPLSKYVLALKEQRIRLDEFDSGSARSIVESNIDSST